MQRTRKAASHLVVEETPAHLKAKDFAQEDSDDWRNWCIYDQTIEGDLYETGCHLVRSRLFPMVVNKTKEQDDDCWSKGKIVAATLSNKGGAKRAMLMVYVIVEDPQRKGTSVKVKYLLDPDKFFRCPPADRPKIYGDEGTNFLSDMKRWPTNRTPAYSQYLLSMGTFSTLYLEFDLCLLNIICFPVNHCINAYTESGIHLRSHTAGSQNYPPHSEYLL